MIQRIFEIVAGLCASLVGFLVLFSFPSGTFLSGYSSDQKYRLAGQPTPPLAWLPVMLLLVTALTGIALGPLLQAITGSSRVGHRSYLALTWAGRLALWLSTLGLIVLIYLTGFSIGLTFIPSATLALVACVLALISNPASNMRA